MTIIDAPTGIDATGARDVTHGLASLIRDTHPDDTIRLAQGAMYRVEGRLRTTDRPGLDVDMNGATIFRTTPNHAGRIDASDARGFVQIEAVRGSNHRWRNGTVKGAHPNAGSGDGGYVAAYEGQAAFGFEGTDGIELDHITITDTYGDFVHLARDFEPNREPRALRSSHAWIHDCAMHRCGRSGFVLTGAQDVIFERNHMTETARSMVNIEAGTSVERLWIIDSVWEKGRLYWVANHGEAPAHDVVLMNNRGPREPLQIEAAAPGADKVKTFTNETLRRRRWWVLNNRSNAEAAHRAYRFIGYADVTIAGNRQRVREGSPGMVLWNVDDFEVRDNDFSPGGTPAIEWNTGRVKLTELDQPVSQGTVPPLPAPPDMPWREAA